MPHIILLGDSILDNAAYVGGGPDVVAQLRALLAAGWQATLLAVDGSVTADVARQLERLPAEATHLVVSAGGNDALWQAGVLDEPAQSVAQALDRLADIAHSFRRGYAQMLQAVAARGLPTVLCTVYYPRFPEPGMQRRAVTALTVFNDAILLEAFAAGLPVLDLRLICSEDTDYANPIEPGVPGGRKISAAIWRAVTEHDFGTHCSGTHRSGAHRTQVFI